MTVNLIRSKAGYLPITAYQSDMVACSANPETPDAYHLYFTLQSGVRVKPQVNPRQLRRAFDTLVQRHDSLRLRFVYSRDRWQAEIQNAHPVGLEEFDLSHADDDAQERFVQELAQRPIRAHEGPCFQMALIRGGAKGDIVLLRAHHAIIDGYGLIVLIEELLKLLLRFPLLGKGISHKAFAEGVARQALHNRDDKLSYWTRNLLPLPEDLNIGRTRKGLVPFTPELMTRTIQKEGLLTQEIQKNLERNVATNGSSIFALIYAAFAEAICDMAGQKEALICSWVGRHDARTQDFVGCDHRMVQHVYRASTSALSEKAAGVSKDIYEALQNLPCDVFTPGSPVMTEFSAQNRTLWRFQVHNTLPTARLAKSPFSKLLFASMKGAMSFGSLQVETLRFLRECESRFELSVFIHQTPEGQQATLVADSAAFDAEELEWIAQRMRANLSS